MSQRNKNTYIHVLCSLIWKTRLISDICVSKNLTSERDGKELVLICFNAVHKFSGNTPNESPASPKLVGPLKRHIGTFQDHTVNCLRVSTMRESVCPTIVGAPRAPPPSTHRGGGYKSMWVLQ